MKNNQKDVYKTYEKIADWYDKHRSTALFEKPWLDKAIDILPKTSEVLDLGCGTGTPMVPYFLEKGFKVTGVDGSEKLISIARSRHAQAEFIISDMRDLVLSRKFDLVVAWHSFFHLSQDDQRAMFEFFVFYLKPGGVLLFTSGPEAGEVWSENGGESLYHASLSHNEYKTLLHENGFTIIEHKVSDPECGGATVWLARL